MQENTFDKNYYFGGVYEDYNVFNDYPEMAADLISRFPTKSFLDIGCGCGNLVRELKQQAERKFQQVCDVQGIDASEFAVKIAGAPYVKHAACQRLPFADQRFETVYILTTFSYLPTMSEIHQAMMEAYRVAKIVIVFEDVYTVPEVNTDDYDPLRRYVFSQEEWVLKWRGILTSRDTINTEGDEIIIRKFH